MAIVSSKGPNRQAPQEKQRKAKKSLGQNFLVDQMVLEAITEAIDPKENETIVEIGPGHGELTEYLLASGVKVTAIEKDHELASELKSWNDGSLKVIEGDALEKVKSLELRVKNWKLVGNIPYYITGQLFRILSELKNKPSVIVFTIQKEVAERICARPGEMSLLAASIQVWAEPEIVGIVPKESFRPVPKVDSAIIKLKVRPIGSVDLKAYYDLLHIIFKQPRKTIFNNLRAGGVPEHKIGIMLSRSKLDIRSRPQDFNIDALAGLVEIFG